MVIRCLGSETCQARGGSAQQSCRSCQGPEHERQGADISFNVSLLSLIAVEQSLWYAGIAYIGERLGIS